jgi:hypothetical protein
MERTTMANEGIMSLPGMGGMQSEQAPQSQAPTVTSADSYDAALTALGIQDPQAVPAVRAAVQEAMADLDLTPKELELLIQAFEFVSNNPAEYRNMVAQLLKQGVIDPGDLPEDYDPQFIGVVLMVLNEMRMQRAQGAVEPAAMSPIVEGLEPVAMAEGGLADVASFLAAQGRNGDTMLAHITPEEAQLLKDRGGSGTINPITGLPEFFLKKLFKSIGNAVKKVLQSPIGRIIGTIALAAVLGPAGVGLQLGSTAAASAAINAGLASAGTTLLGGGSIKEALVAGAMGYVGGGGTIMGASPVSAIGQYLPGAAGGALNTGLATGLIGAGIGKLGGMSTQDALKMGLTSGATAAALSGLKDTSLGRTGEEQAVRDDVFRRAMAGDQTAADMVRSGDYSGAIKAPGAVSSAGTVGTAQDLLASTSPGDPSALQLPPGAAPEPGYTVAGAPSTGGTTPVNVNAPLQLPPGAAPEPGYTVAGAKPGFFDSMVTGAKDLYNEYLSPSRPGLPADAGIFTKYGPLVAAGTAAVGAAGGMKSEPANPNPAFNRNYTGLDYMRDNPNMFQGGLDNYRPPAVPNPVVVPTPSYGSIPVGQPGTTIPMGITNSPAGIAQPYNVAGLYGVPLLYGPPPGRAKGGEMTMSDFPRKNGPINGPGTGTSDSIPAMLSDGEFVFTAKAVRNAGNGSRRKGAARMYKLMKMLEGGPVKAK